MKGYVYIMFKGADPGQGWTMTDPIFGKKPTLGACVPQIRRAVTRGDWIFPISGRTPKVQQYVVGGIRVSEKIDALAAYARFPENRQRKLENGEIRGNVIVTPDGKQAKSDYHSNFDKRIDNYLVGDKSISVEGDNVIERARAETTEFLAKMFGKDDAKKPADAIGRYRKLDEGQVEEMLEWMNSLRTGRQA
jgi:hypothetical protein